MIYFKVKKNTILAALCQADHLVSSWWVMSLVMCSHQCVLQGSSIVAPSPWQSLCWFMWSTSWPLLFPAIFFWDMKTYHRFSRVPCYKIYLLQFPLRLCLRCESGTYPFLFPTFLRFPLQSEVPPGQPAALCCSELGWELSVFCASVLKLCLADNLESAEITGLFLNENLISLFWLLLKDM